MEGELLITSDAKIVQPRRSWTLEDNVVHKANQLLGLYTPSQKLFVNGGELIQHISSMTVAITEAAFNIRIRGVDRRPVKTSQYISNIQACLNVLHKFMEIPPLQAESIYYGDLMQLDQLFDVFLSSVPGEQTRPKSDSLFSIRGPAPAPLKATGNVMSPVSEETHTEQSTETKHPDWGPLPEGILSDTAFNALFEKAMKDKAEMDANPDMAWTDDEDENVVLPHEAAMAEKKQSEAASKGKHPDWGPLPEGILSDTAFNELFEKAMKDKAEMDANPDMAWTDDEDEDIVANKEAVSAHETGRQQQIRDILPSTKNEAYMKHSRRDDLGRMLEEAREGNLGNEQLNNMLQKESLNYRRQRSEVLQSTKTRKQRDEEDLIMRSKVTALKKRLNHEIILEEKENRIKQRRREQQNARTQQSTVDIMKREKIKSRRLEAQMVAESRGKEKLRQDTLRDVISKMYKETLKAEKERIREERTMVGASDPDENERRKKERVDAIEHYFNERIKLIRELRCKEMEEREAMEHAQELEAKQQFREAIKAHDTQLTEAMDKSRSESDSWFSRVRDIDPSVILKRSMSPSVRKHASANKRQKKLRDIAQAYLPGYAKQF